MFELTILILYYLFVLPRQAKAYLDPGTGSYIIQLAIGLLLGGGYLTRVYWSKIKARLKSIFKSDKKNEKRLRSK